MDYFHSSVLLLLFQMFPVRIAEKENREVWEIRVTPGNDVIYSETWKKTTSHQRSNIVSI